MLNVFTRALLHPFDYGGALRRHRIVFLEKREIIPGTWTFLFEKPDALSWLAGQHAIFKISGVRGKDWRAFSVASSPHENVIRIATNIPEQHSNFKAALLSLAAGDTIIMYGPYGEFHAKRTRPQHIVGVAGGIGITPFRALTYEVANGHLPETQLTLIYSARDKYAFETELTLWRQQSEQVLIRYVRTPEEVAAALSKLYEQHKNKADYYVSGSPGMITDLQKTCRAMGIRRIMSDPFKGY